MKQPFFTLFFISAHSLVMYGMDFESLPTLQENKFPLHLAVCYNKQEEIKALISDGTDVNAVNIFGDTPLHVAAMLGHQEAATLLIAQHAHLNIQNGYKRTPLYLAVMYNKIALVKHLLAAHADPTITSLPDHLSPLHIAAYSGFVAIVQMLIDAGANVNQRDKNNHNPLSFLLEKQKINNQLMNRLEELEECLCMLVAAGSHTHKTTPTIAYWFTWTNITMSMLIKFKFAAKSKIYKLLILAGHRDFDYGIKGNDIGATALMYTAAKGNIDDIISQLNPQTNVCITDDYGRNVFRILTIILNNKDDLGLTAEQQDTYNKIMRLCYRHLAKNLWCIYKKPNSALSKLPLDILKYVMLLATGINPTRLIKA